MPKKDSYYELLKQDFNNLIETLELKQERQKHFLRSRWLDRVLCMEGRAIGSRNQHGSVTHPSCAAEETETRKRGAAGSYPRKD